MNRFILKKCHLGILHLLLPAVMLSFCRLYAAGPSSAPSVTTTPIATNFEAIVAERKANEGKNIEAIQKQLMEAIKTAPDSVATPMSKVTMPIANHSNGRVKSMFNADYALFPVKDNDYLRAKNITIEMFTPLGDLESIFLSDNGVYDSKTKVGYCEGPVRLLYRSVKVDKSGLPKVEVLEITGTNMVFDIEDEGARITVPVSPVVRFDGFMDGIGKVFK